MPDMRMALNAVIGFLLLSYPIAIYLGIQYLPVWAIALVLLSVLVLRFYLTKSSMPLKPVFFGAGLIFCGIVVWTDEPVTLRFYPVLISALLLLTFAGSLRFPPTVIERLARMQHPQLPPEGVVYTRRVTIVWCIFFVMNGAVALYTALWSSFEWWSLYNGCIAYVLMGMVMALEYWVRIRTQNHVR